MDIEGSGAEALTLPWGWQSLKVEARGHPRPGGEAEAWPCRHAGHARALSLRAGPAALGMLTGVFLMRLSAPFPVFCSHTVSVPTSHPSRPPERGSRPPAPSLSLVPTCVFLSSPRPRAWFQIPARLLTACVTLGKFFCLSAA